MNLNNIILNSETEKVLLTDFLWPSFFKTQDVTNFQPFAYGYIAPEVYNLCGKDTDTPVVLAKEVDIFALAMVILRIFNDETPEDALFRKFKVY